MVIRSARETYETWRKVVLAKYLEDVPAEKEFEIASKINHAIGDGLPDTIYDGVWMQEIHNGKPMYESIAKYLEAMGYQVDFTKAQNSDRILLHIRWDKPTDMTF